MLRGILSVLQLVVAADRTAEAKRDFAWAAAAGVAAFLGAAMALLFASLAVFLALQPLMAPAWAALAAAGAALVVGAIPFVVFACRRSRARRRAARVPVTDPKTESAVLIGTLASAFLSGVATGTGQRVAARNS